MGDQSETPEVFELFFGHHFFVGFRFREFRVFIIRRILNRLNSFVHRRLKRGENVLSQNTWFSNTCKRNTCLPRVMSDYVGLVLTFSVILKITGKHVVFHVHVARVIQQVYSPRARGFLSVCPRGFYLQFIMRITGQKSRELTRIRQNS